MAGALLFPDASPYAEVLARFARDDGVLPEQAIREFAARGIIDADTPIGEGQFQCRPWPVSDVIRPNTVSTPA